MLVQTCMILCGTQNDNDSLIRLSIDRVRHSFPTIMTNILLCVPQKKESDMDWLCK